MNKTKIDWCDMSWNPVTGCLHGCKYCYARNIANRFGGASETHCNETVGTECQWETEAEGEIHSLIEPIYDPDRGCNAPYPFYFDPTFHRYRLNEPEQKKKPRTIFVCSMSDLFGAWVPDEWIQEVFKACAASPQHRYLFLTKNPKRYSRLVANYSLPFEHWYGFTFTGCSPLPDQLYSNWNTFVSMEPLLQKPNLGFLHYDNVKWVIIGAETGNRKEKVIPQRSWIESIVNDCRSAGVPVFMKSSLTDIWGAPLIQQFPWEV